MNRLRVGSKRLMKDINRARIIAEVRENGPISRSEVAKKTGLVLSTISKLCDELITEGVLFETGEGQSTGGRRPINMSFNNSYGQIVVVKIEDQALVVGISNLRPHILESWSTEFTLGAPFDIVRDLLLKNLAVAAAKIESNDKRLLGIGIAVSGLVNQTEGVLITSTLLGWKNIGFTALLKERFGCEVYVDNDVNCYTLSQNWHGIGKTLDNFCCVTIGEGIGAGVIVEGQLYRGAIGGAGEIGHMIVYGNGRSCYCGQHGCLEAYASSQAIVRTVRERTGSDARIEDIVAKARTGDPICFGAIESAGQALALGFINLIMHYNPQAIISAILGDHFFANPPIVINT